jgi:hypothetical protein
LDVDNIDVETSSESIGQPLLEVFGTTAFFWCRQLIIDGSDLLGAVDWH